MGLRARKVGHSVGALWFQGAGVWWVCGDASYGWPCASSPTRRQQRGKVLGSWAQVEGEGLGVWDLLGLKALSRQQGMGGGPHSLAMSGVSCATGLVRLQLCWGAQSVSPPSRVASGGCQVGQGYCCPAEPAPSTCQLCPAPSPCPKRYWVQGTLALGTCQLCPATHPHGSGLVTGSQECLGCSGQGLI